MLSYTDLKKGVIFLKDGDPYEVLEANFSRMQQRKAVVQTKIRNVRTEKTYEVALQASDSFEEAKIERKRLVFLYAHRNEYIFTDPANKKNRYTLAEGTLGDKIKWLKPNTEVVAVFFGEKLLGIMLPIKMDLKVTEAPPGLQGDRSNSGNKSITLETGTVIQAPLFINTDDIVRINTETGEYTERVEKA
ncbi:MAG: elongation factor P [Candidatus Sungbacteria bacterium]|nr:elongation factor P [Candidatus Sungbacteria bacterium]